MDPGAVPGASTTTRGFRRYNRAGALWGRTRFDMSDKDMVFARHDTAVIGSKTQLPMIMKWHLLLSYTR